MNAYHRSVFERLRSNKSFLLPAALLLWLGASAQPSRFQQSPNQVTKVAGTVYMLEGSGGISEFRWGMTDRDCGRPIAPLAPKSKRLEGDHR